MAKPTLRTNNSFDDLTTSGYKVFDACELSNGSPCSPCREHINIQTQILTATENTLEFDKLLLKQLELRTTINKRHDPITGKLPLEVTSIIFEFSLPDDWSLSTAEVQDSYCDIDNDLLFGPLFLGAVCEAWRDIAWATKSLWTVIRIFFERRLNWNDVDIVSAWLDRSGEHLLSIFLSEDDSVDSPDAPHEVINRVMTLINQHSIRWGHLEVSRGVRADDSYEAMRMLGANCAVSPGLHTLTARNLDRDEAILFTGMSATNKPQPQNVRISSCCLDALNIQWSHVTTLVADTAVLHECFQILKSAPQLVNCSFGLVEDDGLEILTRANLIPSHPIVHGALQSVEFKYWRRHEDFTSTGRLPDAVFFESFVFPNLTHYRFDELDAGLHSIPAHISSSPLTSLTISYTECHYRSLVAVLRETSGLRTLRLFELLYQGDNDDLDLLGLLADTSIPSEPNGKGRALQQAFLPNLETLEYRLIDTSADLTPARKDLFWDHVSNVVGPIEQIYDPRRRPLSNLHIAGYYYYASNGIPPTTYYIDREIVLRLLEVAQAGVMLDLKDGPRFNQYDVLELSMNHYGVVDMMSFLVFPLEI